MVALVSQLISFLLQYAYLQQLREDPFTMWARFVQSLPMSSFSFRTKQRSQQISTSLRSGQQCPLNLISCATLTPLPQSFFSLLSSHSDLYGSLSLKSPSFKHSWLHLAICVQMSHFYSAFLQNRLLSFALCHSLICFLFLQGMICHLMFYMFTCLFVCWWSLPFSLPRFHQGQ